MRICSIEQCNRPLLAKGMCNMHYKRQRRGASARAIARNDPNYVNPWRMDGRGYVYRSNRSGVGSQKIWQHREVMEGSIGRPLLREEEVHHVNGDRSDNRIENLELWSTRQPKGQRVEDKLAWARDIIELYG